MRKDGLKNLFRSRIEGFTLLELIVVLAGLGILSSLALPNFIALLDSNKVDEIKALLNSAAADCLQKKRSEDDPVVDEEIISDAIIEKNGFQINQSSSIFNDKGKAKCSLLLLEPIKGDKNDLTRYNIGFQLLSNGKLDKLASTEMEAKRPDCIKWAGTCKISECAKKLEDYKNKIRAERETCSTRLTEWKKTMKPDKYQQWDASKGPDGPGTCPLAPPTNLDDDTCDTSYQGTNKCNVDGCNAPIWGLWNDETNTGTTYSTETAYKNAREILIGEKCAKQIKEEYEEASPPFTNPSSAGVPLSECRDELYWFVDGESKGDEKTWKEARCEKKKQSLLGSTHSGPIEYCETSPIYICGGEEMLGERDIAKAKFETCLAQNKDAQCTMELNEAAVKQQNGGAYTSPTPLGMSAPVGKDCNVQYWYCEGKIHRTKEDYDADDNCKQTKCTTTNPACYYEQYWGYQSCFEYASCMRRKRNGN